MSIEKTLILVKPDGVRRALAQATVVTGSDPCILPKARKNNAEREGARAAHRRDRRRLDRVVLPRADRASLRPLRLASYANRPIAAYSA